MPVLLPLDSPYLVILSLPQAFIRGAYYGTTYQALADAQSSDKVCLLDVDTQGVQNIRASDLACRYLFVSPPSVEALGACHVLLLAGWL